MNCIKNSGITANNLILTTEGYIPLLSIKDELIWNSTNWMFDRFCKTKLSEKVWRVTAGNSDKSISIECCGSQLIHLMNGHKVFTCEVQDLYSGLLLASPILPDRSSKNNLEIVSVEVTDRLEPMYYPYEGYRLVVNGFLLGVKRRLA